MEAVVTQPSSGNLRLGYDTLASCHILLATPCLQVEGLNSADLRRLDELEAAALELSGNERAVKPEPARKDDRLIPNQVGLCVKVGSSFRFV